MKDLGYTLTHDRFELIEKPDNMVCNTLIDIPAKNASTSLSAIYMRGEFDANCNLYFTAKERTGVILCIQLLKNTNCLKFSSVKRNAINYYQDVAEARFILSDNPYRHTYSQGSVINRLDVFFPFDSLGLLSDEIVEGLRRDSHLLLEFNPLDPSSQTAKEHLVEYMNEIKTETISGTIDKLITLLNRMFE